MSVAPLRPSGLAGLLVALALAAGFVLLTFGLPFVLGISAFWQTEVDDVTQYIAGFNHYFTSPWQFPLLAFNSVNYPVGTRATFVDAIPLYALLLKVLLPSSLAPFNPYGIWIALCFMLQAVGAWWLSKELRSNSWPLLIGLTVVLLTSPALMARIAHISLMSHWILLFALALYVRGRHVTAMPIGAWTALLVAGFYVNIYLMVMATGIYVAAGLAGGVHRDWRQVLGFLVPFAVLGGSLFIMLLPMPLAEVTREWGFGYYSMNLLSPLLGGYLLQVQAATAPGQYEGFNYLGLGVLIAFAVALRFCQLHDRNFFKRHWPLSLMMLAYTLYALSNQLYFAESPVLTVKYPEILAGLTSQFRASGRFFWAVGYCVAVFSLVVLYRRLGRATFAAAVIALVGLQLADLKVQYKMLKTTITREAPQYMDYTAWDKALGADVRTLYFYPKFKCGQHPPHASLLPVMKYSGERQYNLNTGYIARYTPRCDDIAEEISGSVLGSSAYIFVRDEFENMARVKALLPADAPLQCSELDFAFVCSNPD